MGKIYELLGQAIKEELPFATGLREDRKRGSYKFIVSGDHCLMHGLARAREKAEQYLWLARCPLNVPKAARPQMALKLCEINHKLICGAFELDPSDQGLVALGWRWRCQMDFRPAPAGRRGRRRPVTCSPRATWTAWPWPMPWCAWNANRRIRRRNCCGS